MVVPLEPRPLNAAERAVLVRILSREFPGSAELLAQVDRAEATAQWYENALSVDIRVPGEAPVPTGTSGVVPVETSVTDENGQLVGEVLVWAAHGVLAALEYATYTDERPAVLPSPGQISFR